MPCARHSGRCACAQPVARHAALAEAALDKPALAGEHLVREFAAVLGGHGALDGLDDVGHGAAVVDELLHAIVDLDLGLLTAYSMEALWSGF